MRVTIGEMLGRITAKQGSEIERDLDKHNTGGGKDAERRELHESNGRAHVVEVDRIRARPKRKA